MASNRITGESFWETNLDEIESSFLKRNAKITEQPTTLDPRVPPQGSVILDKVARSEKPATLWERATQIFR